MTKKRFIAWVMALAMIFQMLPATVISEEAPAVVAADVIEVPAVADPAEDEPVEEPKEKAAIVIGSNEVAGAKYATVTFAVPGTEEIQPVTVAVGEALNELPAIELPVLRWISIPSLKAIC